MTSSPSLIEMVAIKAKEYKTGIHAHLYEHRDEVSYCLQRYKKRPADFLYELGALGSNFLAAHSVVMSESDIRLYSQRGVKVIHCPHTNLTSHGIPKTPNLLANNISIGLGSDGTASYSANLFNEMRVLRAASKAFWGLPSFDPTVLKCTELLKMVTIGGASALQLDDIGTIEVGKKADVILIDLNKPHLAASHNIINTLVESACAQDVTDSIINGKIIMKDRNVLTMDEEKIIAQSKQYLTDIAKRAFG